MYCLIPVLDAEDNLQSVIIKGCVANKGCLILTATSIYWNTVYILMSLISKLPFK